MQTIQVMHKGKPSIMVLENKKGNWSKLCCLSELYTSLSSKPDLRVPRYSTHTHTHTHARTHTHTHTHTLTHTCTHTHMHTLIHTHTLTHICTHSSSLIHTYNTDRHTHTLTCMDQLITQHPPLAFSPVGSTRKGLGSRWCSFKKEQEPLIVN